MSAKYDTSNYYTNADLQLIINLKRIREELTTLVSTEDCDACRRLKCDCPKPDRRAKLRKPKDWSFKLTSLDVGLGVDLWRGEIHVSSGTVEEFFKSLRKKQGVVQC